LGRSAALRRAGRSDAAIEVLTQLAETHGDLPQVHQALADGLRRDGDYDAANASYSTALSLFTKTMPFHWRLYFHRAVTFERLGNWSEAEADLRQSLALNPSQPEVLNYLGYSLVERQEKIDEALTLIERAAAERPDTGFIIDSLGWVLYRRGEFEQAVTHLERASELEPVDPVVNDHLGDAYWAVGRETEARFQWSRALSFDPTEDDAERIRLKLELGLDEVLLREGAPAIQVANDDS
jgi:Flp pilus assembly protein TadD